MTTTEFPRDTRTRPPLLLIPRLPMMIWEDRRHLLAFPLSSDAGSVGIGAFAADPTMVQSSVTVAVLSAPGVTGSIEP
jgi:hypothetical protein